MGIDQKIWLKTETIVHGTLVRFTREVWLREVPGINSLVWFPEFGFDDENYPNNFYVNSVRFATYEGASMRIELGGTFEELYSFDSIEEANVVYEKMGFKRSEGVRR